MSGRRRGTTDGLSGTGAGLTVDLEVSLAHECLMSLSVYSDAARRATYEIGPAWFEQVRARATPDLLSTLEQFTLHTNQIWEHLLTLVYDCPAPRDVPTMLCFLEQVDPLELRLHLIGYYVREHRRVTPPQVIF
ncbi:MAG TPA: hypothetical protein VF120_00060, partial [Ktedonobacterales bacterium]